MPSFVQRVARTLALAGVGLSVLVGGSWRAGAAEAQMALVAGKLLGTSSSSIDLVTTKDAAYAVYLIRDSGVLASVRSSDGAVVKLAEGVDRFVLAGAPGAWRAVFFADGALHGISLDGGVPSTLGKMGVRPFPSVEVSANGAMVAYLAGDEGGPIGLFVGPADGSSPPRSLLDVEPWSEYALSADGRFVAVRVNYSDDRADLKVGPVDGPLRDVASDVVDFAVPPFGDTFTYHVQPQRGGVVTHFASSFQLPATTRVIDGLASFEPGQSVLSDEATGSIVVSNAAGSRIASLSGAFPAWGTTEAVLAYVGGEFVTLRRAYRDGPAPASIHRRRVTDGGGDREIIPQLGVVTVEGVSADGHVVLSAGATPNDAITPATLRLYSPSGVLLRSLPTSFASCLDSGYPWDGRFSSDGRWAFADLTEGVSRLVAVPVSSPSLTVDLAAAACPAQVETLANGSIVLVDHIRLDERLSRLDLRIVPPPSVMRALSPRRLADTRPGAATTDGQSVGAGRLTAGATMEVLVAGRGGLPAVAVGALLNVTAVDPAGEGFVTVYPCGTTRPTASNLNLIARQTRPNLVAAKLGEGGRVCLYTSAETHLIVDVVGASGPLAALQPLPPSRLTDSRGVGLTADGVDSGEGRLRPGQQHEIRVAGRGGVPANATMVALNVTIAGPAGEGFATVFPCGQPQPNASQVNFATGETVPNAVFSSLSSDGKVCVTTSVAADLIVDVTGFAGAGAAVGSIVPARLADSRAPASTIDGTDSGVGKVAARSTTRVRVAGRGGVPRDAVAVMLNLTAVDGVDGGFVTLFPCGERVPETSNLNLSGASPRANAAFVRIGQGGDVCLYSSDAAHLIVDVTSFTLV